MLAMARGLSRTASKLLHLLFKLCWLMPVHVSDDERILRAIYSPYHVKNNKLKHQAFDPTPGTDEVSVMRFEYMGVGLCRRKAKSLGNPKKAYYGFAVLRTGVVRTSAMDVVDSRRHFCGHADIKLLMLKPEPNEPPPPEAGKRLKDLKDALLHASNYVPDPNPGKAWRGNKLEPPL